MTSPQLCVGLSTGLLLVGVVKMPMIKLQSSDGEIFEVEVEIAKASNTIKTMIEGQVYTLLSLVCVYIHWVMKL